ncbi:hypothetical protein [Proteiniclasticum ruminis]|uniref:Uncharacterized protein n=1 Tax=Proteiniclasticum ruminis TaxID=398199 RepID=A0A1I4ZKS8_9CLOT|nr:hypothetical protein [Proteiniclasticum ruminis]SFN50881.1 hypothetical protein SAMN04488695_10237 [Proteiniclasticum ruminis]
MKHDEYMKKYGVGFSSNAYLDGEVATGEIEELLEILKDKHIKCPDIVSGLVLVKITIDTDSEVDRIEESLWDHDFAGEDYEMPEKGKEYLKKCFEEYNEKYANHGNYCDEVKVEVPEEMKYELEEHDEA